MDNSPQEWMRAAERTFIVRNPTQQLATFGSTTISYYVVTDPIYQEIEDGEPEGVIRTGKVVAARPAIVTPSYAMNLQGFSSEAYEYLRHLAREYGPGSPGVLYQYTNEAHKVEIVKGEPGEIAGRIGKDLDQRKENLSVVLVGVDELWDIALLKFMYEFTSSSAVQKRAGDAGPGPFRRPASPRRRPKGRQLSDRAALHRSGARRRPGHAEARAGPLGPLPTLRDSLPQPLPRGPVGGLSAVVSAHKAFAQPSFRRRPESREGPGAPATVRTGA